jgi:tRNA G10  N-methylase Trm11
LNEDRFILVTAQRELALAEVVTYFEKKGNRFHIEGVSDHAIILNAPGFDVINAMEWFGGLFKIGSVRCVLDDKTIKNSDLMESKLDSVRFYDWIDDKARWSLSTYRDESGFDPDLLIFLREYFRQRLKEDHIGKARYVPPKRVRKTDQEIIVDELIRKKILPDGFEILAAKVLGHYYIGRTMEVVPNQQYRQRDLGRPVQNPRLTIPPKIARVLINLTGLEPGETLLDPFCGIGTVLQEATIRGLRIIGCDVDTKRVSDTLKNLKWLSDTYGLHIDGLPKRVFRADARLLSKELGKPVDAVATEPILLPPLKSYLSESDATEKLQKTAAVYEESLPEMASVLKRRGRLVLVVPYIQTNRRSTVTLNLEEVFKEADLRLHRFPEVVSLRQPVMATLSRDQKVQRGIYVLEKR